MLVIRSGQRLHSDLVPLQIHLSQKQGCTRNSSCSLSKPGALCNPPPTCIPSQAKQRGLVYIHINYQRFSHQQKKIKKWFSIKIKTSLEKHFFDITKRYIQTLIIMTKAENTRILSPTPRWWMKRVITSSHTTTCTGSLCREETNFGV